MKKIKRLAVLTIIFLFIAMGCEKKDDNETVNMQQEKENLLCKSWQRTYLTIDSDTSFSENWIHIREFLKDNTYILTVTRLGDPGEEDETVSYNYIWRWSGNNYTAIETQRSTNTEKWTLSHLPKLTITQLILEQDRENEGLFRFHYMPK